MSLQSILPEVLYITVDSLKFGRYPDALGAMRHALAAPDAVISLAESRDCPVVTEQILSFQFPVVFLFSALRDLALVDTVVIVLEYLRNVNSIRAWHAVFAYVAINSGIFFHQNSHFLQEFEVIL